MDDKNTQVMERVRRSFEKSGLSLEALGQRMGYPENTGRKSAWQFLNKTVDPRLSMLYRFSNALSISLKSLIK